MDFPVPPYTAATKQGHSALGFLMPFVEQGNLGNVMRFDQSVATPVNLPAPYGTAPTNITKVKLTMCPSAPDRMTDYGPYFSGGNASAPPGLLGASDYAPPRGIHSSFQASCAPASPASARDGMLTPFGGKPKFLDATDGTSNTLMFVERAGLQQVYLKGKPVTPNTPGTAGWHLNGAWADYNIAKEVRGSDSAVPAGTVCEAINGLNINGLYSFHPGGVNVLRGDGAVSFLKDSTSPAVLGALITKAGGEVTGDF